MYSEECIRAAKLLSNLCLSSHQQIYLANAKDLVGAMKTLSDNYPDLNREKSPIRPVSQSVCFSKEEVEKVRIDTGEENQVVGGTIIEQQRSERAHKVKAKLNLYNNRALMDRVIYSVQDKDDIKLSAKDITLRNFSANYQEMHTKMESGEVNEALFDAQSPVRDRNQEYLYSSRRVSFVSLTRTQQTELNGYLSTPKFIKYLADISNAISDVEDKEEQLQR